MSKNEEELDLFYSKEELMKREGEKASRVKHIHSSVLFILPVIIAARFFLVLWIRESHTALDVINVLLSACLIIVLWVKLSSETRLFRVATTLLLLCEGVGFALDRRGRAGMFVVVFIASVTLMSIFLFLKKEKKSECVLFVLSACASSVLVMVRCVNQCNVVRGNTVFDVVLILSVVLGAIIGVIAALKAKVKKPVHRIGCFFGSVVLSFVCVWFCYVSANYAFDTSSAVTYHVLIEDKRVVHHRKSPVTYKFEVEINGERLDINVPYVVYSRHQVGDVYGVSMNTGAFGLNYYLAKDY